MAPNIQVSIEKYRKALAIQIDVLGDHLNVATAHCNIGTVLQTMGDYDGALVEFNRCLAIRESVLGLDHSITKGCMEWIEIVKELQRNNRPAVSNTAETRSKS